MQPQVMGHSERPLSPHLGIYRPMYTMVLSISHRITGIFLSAGLVLFVYWLGALASGAAAYGAAVERLRSPLMQLLLLGWLFSFFFHLANGIRHLAWDCGFGYERRQARASGWAVFIAAVLLTLLCVAWVLRMQGASA
ncbi:MAG TPA: succinate dehydrogenase, cytochrome b556 subunit [Steroidobacteraceae bacterium]